MTLIKRAEAETFAKEAVALNLGDLQREGEALVAQARTRAESILAKGRAERDWIVGGASERGYKAGFARGHAEGMIEGREKGEIAAIETTSAAVSALAEQWGLAMVRFEESRDRMLSEARADIVRFAVLFAEKLARCVIDADPAVVERTLEAVVARVAEPTGLAVSVHPDDLEIAGRLMPSLVARLGDSAHASVIADGGVARGGCVVRTAGGGLIDADIETQIDRLVRELLPESSRRLPAEGPARAATAGDAADDGDGEAPAPDGATGDKYDDAGPGDGDGS